MKATLLTAKPTSGTYPEIHWASGSRPNLWVLFEAAEPWVGIFASGQTYLSAVYGYGSGDGPHLVIAGGQGYVLDVARRALIRRTTWDDAITAAYLPGADAVLVAEYTSAWLERPDGSAPITARGGWTPSRTETRRLALDGIVFDAVEGEQVRGRAWWWDGWHAFVLDVPRRAFALDGDLAEAPYDESCTRPQILQGRKLLLF